MRSRLILAIIANFVSVPVAFADGEPVAISGVPPSTLARGIYVGVFGGGGYGSSTDITQRGTAYFIEAQGGPLAVNANGSTGGGGVGFVGGQVGYEFSRNALMLPAFEIEGFYLASGTRQGIVESPNDRLGEHNFDDSFKVNNTVFLANMVVSFQTSYYGLTPYIGGGIERALPPTARILYRSIRRSRASITSIRTPIPPLGRSRRRSRPAPACPSAAMHTSSANIATFTSAPPSRLTGPPSIRATPPPVLGRLIWTRRPFSSRRAASASISEPAPPGLRVPAAIPASRRHECPSGHTVWPTGRLTNMVRFDT
ncbi:hypothetical protein [Hyphomicrobium sp. 1Nfss2.1]|uniref:hypothetical protein n=1 Tax=Hyphomicrobium sp. 1Nfss2.1 TaxID=3413936 RepID=UPI003C7D4EF4